MRKLTTDQAIQVLSRYDTEYYTPQTRQAHRMAIEALMKREEQPLTMAELRQMNGETVYCLELNADVKISAPKVGLIYVTYNIPGKYGDLKAMGLTLYHRKPEEECHEN